MVRRTVFESSCDTVRRCRAHRHDGVRLRTVNQALTGGSKGSEDGHKEGSQEDEVELHYVLLLHRTSAAL